jgi:hypothetical protein
VLRALGRDRETAQSALRFSLGRATSVEDIDRAVAAVRREVSRLQAAASAKADACAVCGEAGTREQGTWVRFMLNPTGEYIERVTHQVYGCPATQSVCEWLVTQLPGRSWRHPGLGGPQDWAQALDIPLDRLTRLLVVEDALRAALAAAQRQADGGSTMVARG